MLSLPGFQAQAQTLRAVYMEDYAPFCYRNEAGDIVGIQPEIVAELARRLNIDVEHELYPWSRAQALVRSGQADLMLTTPTPERFEYAVFAQEMTTPTMWNLFLRADDMAMIKAAQGLNGLEDLKQYRLLDFQANGWRQRFLSEEAGFTRVTLTSDPARLPALLLAKRGDMVLSSSALMRYHVSGQGLNAQIVELSVDWPYTRFHQVLQLSRQSPWVGSGIIKALDTATREMKADGTYQAILGKYHSPASDADFQSHLDASYLMRSGFYDDYDALPDRLTPPWEEQVSTGFVVALGSQAEASTAAKRVDTAAP
jgi:polar amino acid transport system substrate-binding protein